MARPSLKPCCLVCYLQYLGEESEGAGGSCNEDTARKGCIAVVVLLCVCGPAQKVLPEYPHEVGMMLETF